MEEVRNELQECEPVQLEPFIHQVGGHSSILCLDERTVCKPLIKQELKFYETLPNSMKKFTPEYRGIVRVRFEEDPDGYITVAALAPKSFRVQLSSKKKSKRRRIRLKNSGSIEIEIESELKDLFVAEDGAAVAAVSAAAASAGSGSSGSSSGGIRASHNPWVLKCHRDNLTKLHTRTSTLKEKEPPAQKFVLLENLTWRFEYPCVLDLKMGTRQYGDDATPAKIESQSAKAANSTSGALGVRICGMQVYQTTSGKFLCRNKYYGRKLGVEGFREGLSEFLHNGNRLRIDAIAPLVEKLHELKAVLRTLDTFRFYTSSLLLIYEGLDPEIAGDDEATEVSEESDPLTVQEVMDTATADNHNHTMIRSPPPQSKSTDNFREGGHMSGIAASALSSSTEALTGMAPGVGGIGASASARNSRGSLASRGSTPSASAVSLPRESVDVRLIDFAHATHSGLDLGHCAKEHAGPDAGFILGLSNLIQMLEDILAREGGGESDDTDGLGIEMDEANEA